MGRDKERKGGREWGGIRREREGESGEKGRGENEGEIVK